jgi:hypothetical protein
MKGLLDQSCVLNPRQATRLFLSKCLGSHQKNGIGFLVRRGPGISRIDVAESELRDRVDAGKYWDADVNVLAETFT